MDWNDGTWVDADECGSVRREVGRPQLRRNSYAKMKGLNFVWTAVESHWSTFHRGKVVYHVGNETI